MAKHEDHPTIKQARQLLDIEPDADFLGAISEKFVKADPVGRKLDMARFDQAHETQQADMRQQVQLDRVRRHLRGLDERLRKSGL